MFTGALANRSQADRRLSGNCFPNFAADYVTVVAPLQRRQHIAQLSSGRLADPAQQDRAEGSAAHQHPEQKALN